MICYYKMKYKAVIESFQSISNTLLLPIVGNQSWPSIEKELLWEHYLLCFLSFPENKQNRLKHFKNGITKDCWITKRDIVTRC